MSTWKGITKITSDDIRYAKEFGYVIKLLGVTKLVNNEIEVKVHPMLIPEQHPARDSPRFVQRSVCPW